jgi:hypothetical protein
MNISDWDPKVWEFQNSLFTALIRKNRIRKIFKIQEERLPF